MANKIHLAGYGPYSLPFCQRAYRPGNMTQSPVVRGVAFKVVPEEKACVICAREFLKRRNRQRREKGLPPVEKYNSPTPEKAVSQG